ncbi:OadG family protein [Psychrosphaera sp. B3R10]|uniref:OadG family protein n=1 Tax=unclassified Psychrosphaera TaxID=2641570 RepID=UPI001C095694|nr:MULTISPECIES: OadG family transporter subunit [unclassified Psychrosphaera]MBU2881070.1 OadG family protein [Psychrosphaera sp. I2R16]MBU2989994.1 OadG family protein [Psychrosphaera sp. B3R10]
MNVTELLVEAGILMVVGMSVVFVFLTILIFATKGLTSFVQSFPEPETSTPAPRRNTHSATGDTSQQVVAAISAAIKQHRKKNN